MRNQLPTLLVFTILILLSSCALRNSKESFTLFKDGKVSSIYVSKTDAPQIIRAVGDLQKDIEMVTGTKPKIVHSLSEAGENTIIIGSVKNEEIQKLQKEGKLAEANGIENMSESFLVITSYSIHYTKLYDFITI